MTTLTSHLSVTTSKFCHPESPYDFFGFDFPSSPEGTAENSPGRSPGKVECIMSSPAGTAETGNRIHYHAAR
jgi:hypothetical protein